MSLHLLPDGIVLRPGREAAAEAMAELMTRLYERAGMTRAWAATVYEKALA